MTERPALPRHPISRRTFGLALGAGVAALSAEFLLSGCGTESAAGSQLSIGTSSQPTGTASSTSEASSTGPDAATFPITLTHKFGDTVVPAAPVRVVCAGVTEHDTVLALGVIPVGVTEWYGEQPYATWPWAQAALGDGEPEVLSISDGLQFEKIAALSPDLILATNAGLSDEDYATLTAIAPTIAQSGKFTDYFEPWYLQSAAIATALGKRAEGEAMIADLRARFAAAAAANPAFAGTTAIFLQNAIYDGMAIAYQKGLSTDFITDLGFVVPDGLEQFVTADEGQAYIPVEQLSVLNAAEVLIWATETDEDRPALESTPGYLQLTAVATDKAVYTGGELAGAIYFTSPLSLVYVLEKLVPLLAAVA